MADRIPSVKNHPNLAELWVGIDPEILKLTYDELLEESGADVLLHARICGVDADEQGNVNAVLVAGRAISCERLVMGSVRIMAVCLVTGEAAGVAAAMAAKTDGDVHRVNVEDLRSTLRKNGAILR